MIDTRVIVVASVAYLALLFAIAYFGDRRADRGRSIISNGYIYALSIGVYASSWTYYGSVGRAATTGVGFLPIYLGATVMAAGWWLVLRKIIRICKQKRITSLADFISSRYGKSALLGGLVTVMAVVGIVPYIALQLKAISNSFTILRGEPELATTVAADPPILTDTALYVASCSPPSRSSSAPATWTPPSGTRAWSRPLPSSRWSSWSRSSPSAFTSRT